VTARERPVAVTCGEPAGIGPEIMVKARHELGATCPLFWIGDPRHLPREAAWQEIGDPEEAARVPPERLPVLVHRFPAASTPGQPDPRHAQAVIDVIERAARMAMSGTVAAICTAPISKKVLKDGAGFAFPGHTEFLGQIAGVEQVVMMLACPDLRVVPVTIHIPLAEVAPALSATLIDTTIRITATALRRDFGVENPRIAVAGLNPHAGEGGAIGTEEITIIRPALDRLRSEGFQIAGPLPADTMFHPAARARYDVAVAMYHDQALIPIKAIDFAGGVNVTLGLPFVRTSPDHGTAFDIAGQGSADPTSMIAALRMAADLGRRRA
jgi:4-hydroxythreonine-4-phosphate dehydrogenase